MAIGSSVHGLSRHDIRRVGCKSEKIRLNEERTVLHGCMQVATGGQGGQAGDDVPASTGVNANANANVDVNGVDVVLCRSLPANTPRSRTTSRQTKFVIQPPIYDRFISNFRSKFLQFFLPYLHSLYPIKNKSRVQSTRRERIKIIIITVINMQQQGGDRILIFRGRRRKEEGQTENRFRIFLGRNDVIAVDDVDVNYRYYLYYRTHICINSHDSISMLIDLFESEKYPCQMRVSEFVHPYIPFLFVHGYISYRHFIFFSLFFFCLIIHLERRRVQFIF